MKSGPFTCLSSALALAASLGTAHSGTEAKDVIETPSPSSISPWEFRITPYGWLTGLDGTVGGGGLTAGVDAPFFDEILDNLKMAAAVDIEARYDRWGFIIDGFYADLGAGGSIPGNAYKSASVDLKQFIGQASVAYRIYETPKGFVDVFAGARYNGLWLDIGAVVDAAGVTAISTNASTAIVGAVDTEAQAIVDPRIEEYRNAAAADRVVIENDVQAAIEGDAGARVKEDIERELVRIRRNNGLKPEAIVLNRLTRAIRQETVALAEATAELKVAQLRASVNSTLQADVDRARRKVDQADKDLANALDTQVSNALPTKASANKQWVDPIIGVRGQYNFNDKWYLAGNADIGGFGVSSDITWSVEAVVGYNFTRNVSAELGYRYLYTDYQDGGFVYDLAAAGLYTGINIRF